MWCNVIRYPHLFPQYTGIKLVGIKRSPDYYIICIAMITMLVRQGQAKPAVKFSYDVTTPLFVHMT